MISNSFTHTNKDSDRDICDKTMKQESKTNHLKSLTHNQYEKSFRTIRNIKNSNFFDIVKLFNDFITHHNRKVDLSLPNCEFKLKFINKFIPTYENRVLL